MFFFFLFPGHNRDSLSLFSPPLRAGKNRLPPLPDAHNKILQPRLRMSSFYCLLLRVEKEVESFLFFRKKGFRFFFSTGGG